MWISPVSFDAERKLEMDVLVIGSMTSGGSRGCCSGAGGVL